MDQDFRAKQSTSAVTLGRKAWTAYVRIALVAVLLLSVAVPIVWVNSVPLAVALLLMILAIAAYRVFFLRSVELYCDDNGVWVFAGLLPWNKGESGVKWRDLDEATYRQSMFSWLFKSYSIRIGHRFTKSSEVLLTSIWHGDKAVMEINSRLQELVRVQRIS